jgi:predicted homoserine dehydrogenase-like protein
MIIVDTALRRREEDGIPLRVALIGAGYMGRAVALQIVTCVPGMRLAAISSRDIARAESAVRATGAEPIGIATRSDLERSLTQGRPAVTDDPDLLCQADGIDAVVDATGDVEFGARVALEALTRGKHVILMNAELDATLGPILKVYADRAGVIVTGADGDEPAVAMNQIRFVRSIGLEPVLAGNVKGMYDPYRTPATQAEFAAGTGQQARMVTSFADGTKLSMETTLVANATGFRADRRGMHGHRCAHVNDVLDHFDIEELRGGRLVDFVVGAAPGSGAFVVGYDGNPARRETMRLFKMGDGPGYVFYRPFHLPHREVPLTIARAALFHDAAVAPLAGPVCETITVAKRDLRQGEMLDGIGGFTSYGLIENSEAARGENLLPMGLSEGCRLERDIPADQPIAFSDVELPEGRLVDRLWAEQEAIFSLAAVAGDR